jgi:hypothetical protein
VGFVLDKVALRQVYLWVLRFPLSISFHHGSPCSYIYWGMNNRPASGRSSETSSLPFELKLKKTTTWTHSIQQRISASQEVGLHVSDGPPPCFISKITQHIYAEYDLGQVYIKSCQANLVFCVSIHYNTYCTWKSNRNVPVFYKRIAVQNDNDIARIQTLLIKINSDLEFFLYGVFLTRPKVR